MKWMPKSKKETPLVVKMLEGV